MVIKVNNLTKRYGDLLALDHFNLEVRNGEILGLLGPNGSGKTTAINCILSLLKYDKGTIEVYGKPMTPDAYEIKSKIGVVMQNVAVFDELTVYENIDYFCGLYIRDKSRRKQYVDEAIEFVGLNDFRRFFPKKLSGGLLRRLNIACGIAHKPELIILDEPTVAVDPQSRNNILEGIQKLNREGATIVYTSHYMEEVERICSRVAIMDKGKVIASGTNEELKNMISLGETIKVELYEEDDAILHEVKNLPHIISVEFKDNFLIAKFSRGKNNLGAVMEYFRTNGAAYRKIYSEPPTLNDVFLEITGKELRD
ncbi:MAG TPA: ABC transporter ATP-binding protein [Thermoanaerobacterales bacterium]|jgi:ABC-2 type transport system ATP-binding protein|nr:ABC transporter ATP-binding protein [Thermoanaerobacterales bacterium]